MISKSKLGAIAFAAAVGLASPVFAANYGASNLAPGASGGGSYGYNRHISTDYRLKHHLKHHHAQPSDTKPQ